ncbi:hypothetical protein [Thauera humireducens]|uniref:hypothetical protein n=1 Tax=Thauera humireducens TaxID=1134435 RepID=UPI0024A8DA2F|nr:hypothetical protein [Thauera humireducens]
MPELYQNLFDCRVNKAASLQWKIHVSIEKAMNGVTSRETKCGVISRLGRIGGLILVRWQYERHGEGETPSASCLWQVKQDPTAGGQSRQEEGAETRAVTTM